MTQTLAPCPNYIGGEWQTPSGTTTPVFNPSTGDVIAECPAGGAAEANAAVDDAAAAAFPAWRETPAVDRARVFFRFRQLIEQNYEKLCVTASREHGKTLSEARGDVHRGLENVEYACGVPTLKKWENLNLNYQRVARIDYDKCIGCNLCYIACEDGAHQCIDLKNPDELTTGLGPGRVPHKPIPKVREADCVGCNLCNLVCPVDDCITMVNIPNDQPAMSWSNYQEKLACGEMQPIPPHP